MPARLSTQLAKLYQSLLSLDEKEKYSKDRAKKIIRRIVDGSGDPILVKVLEFLNSLCWTILQAKDETVKFTITEVFTTTGLGTTAIKRRLELLRGLDFLTKELKQSGSKGGRPGYHYFLRDDVDEKTWRLLFRHDVLRKPDLIPKT